MIVYSGYNGKICNRHYGSYNRRRRSGIWYDCKCIYVSFLHPKLIAVSIDKSARMFNKIMQADKFGVSILSETQEEYSKFFARQQADLEPIVYKKLDGVSVLEDPIAALSCKRDNSFEAGDHIIVTAEVTDLFVNEKDPVIFFGGQYRSLSESI